MSLPANVHAPSLTLSSDFFFVFLFIFCGIGNITRSSTQCAGEEKISNRPFIYTYISNIREITDNKISCSHQFSSFSENSSRTSTGTVLYMDQKNQFKHRDSCEPCRSGNEQHSSDTCEVSHGFPQDICFKKIPQSLHIKIDFSALHPLHEKVCHYDLKYSQ